MAKSQEAGGIPWIPLRLRVTRRALTEIAERFLYWVKKSYGEAMTEIARLIRTPSRRNRWSVWMTGSQFSMELCFAALLLCGKALSAIRGREFSTPDDVRDVARPVLRHRLTLRAEAELDGATPDAVFTVIL